MNLSQAGGCMVLAIFLSRILGLVRDATISYRFGLAADRDAYVAAFALPDLLYFLIAGGALSSALIPVFTRYFSEGESDEAWKVFSSIACILGVVVSLFVVVTWVFANPIVAFLAPGMHPETQQLAGSLARILLPSQIAFFMGGLIFGTMYAQRHYSTPAMAPNIYNVGIICGAIFIAPLMTPMIFGPAWGALVGAIVGNLIIPLLSLKQFGAKFQIRFDFAHPGVKRVFRLMLPVVFGLSLPAVYAMVIRYYGSNFEEGSISALDVGNRIMQAPLGIFGQSLAVAVFPVLSAFHAQSQTKQFLATMSKTARTATFIGLIVSALMITLAPDIVRVLNQYGKFTNINTVYVSHCVAMYGIGVFAWCAHPILTRAFFAIEDAITPVILGTISTIAFLIVCSWIYRAGYGYESLALAVSISAILLFALLMLGIRWKLGRADGLAMLKLLLVAGILAAAVGGLVYAAGQLFPAPTGKRALLLSAGRLLLLGGGGLAIYLLLARLLRLREADYILASFKGRHEATTAPASDESTP